MPLTVANTTTTKPVVAKQQLTIRDIQRAERERIAQLEAEEAAKQSGVMPVDQQMVAQKQAEAQRKQQFSVSNNVKWRCKLSNNVLPNSKPRLNAKRHASRATTCGATSCVKS